MKEYAILPRSPELEFHYRHTLDTTLFFDGGSGGFLSLCRRYSQHILSFADSMRNLNEDM